MQAMEDQQGYAAGPVGEQQEDGFVWPTVQYVMRESLANLSLTVSLARATGTGAQKEDTAGPKELVVNKPEGEAVGLLVKLDDKHRLVVTGTTEESVAERTLNNFTDCVIALVNGQVPGDEAQFFELSCQGTETRVQFQSAETHDALGQEESFVVLGWQQKVHHPEELLLILQRDENDTQRQELLQFLRSYDVPAKGGGPNPLSAPAVPPQLAQQIFAQLQREDGNVSSEALLQAISTSGCASPQLISAISSCGDTVTHEAWDSMASRPLHSKSTADFDVKLEHLLSSTLVCTYVTGEQHSLRTRWLDPVATYGFGGKSVTDYEVMKGIEKHQPVGHGAVVKWDKEINRDVVEEHDIDVADQQEMFVVAAFGHAEKNRHGAWVWYREKDVLLAHLVAHSKTGFSMWPPLSDLGAVVSQRRRMDDLIEDVPVSKPYTIRVPLGTRGESVQYKYSVGVREAHNADDLANSDNVSEATTRHEGRDEEDRRKEMLHRVIVSHYRQMQTAKREQNPEEDAGLLSAPSQADAQKVHYFGDIMSASGFECSNLFIKFELALPDKQWRVDSSQAGFGGDENTTCFTQTSRMVRRKLTDGTFVTFFAFAMPFELNCSANKITAAHPRMLMELHSERQYGSQQLEGYGFVDLTVSPGSHRTVVQCWRPVQSIRQSLREFFLNVSTELEHTSYAGVPAQQEGPFLNKFGFHTESTGRVEVRWNCIMQA